MRRSKGFSGRSGPHGDGHPGGHHRLGGHMVNDVRAGLAREAELAEKRKRDAEECAREKKRKLRLQELEKSRKEEEKREKDKKLRERMVMRKRMEHEKEKSQMRKYWTERENDLRIQSGEMAALPEKRSSVVRRKSRNVHGSEGVIKKDSSLRVHDAPSRGRIDDHVISSGVKETQDVEFEDTLRRAMVEEERKREEMDDVDHRRKAWEERQNVRRRRLALVPAGDGCVTIKFLFPNGERRMRCFRMSDNVALVEDYAILCAVEMDDYKSLFELVEQMSLEKVHPRVSCDKSKTLEELGLTDRGTLVVSIPK